MRGLQFSAFTIGITFSVFMAGQLHSQAKSNLPSPTIAKFRVPFVGCKGESQGDPVAAPNGTNKNVVISQQAAQRLAYYKGKFGEGVLAPRGWYCSEASGTSGATLYVSQNPIPSNVPVSSNGPAVVLRMESGGTSGRFGVAEVIARVFPAFLPFVDRVIAEGTSPASSYVRQPFPFDHLTYRSNRIVEYQTQGDYAGLGTLESGLKPDANPISGVAILDGDTPDMILLSVRLPKDSSGLGSEIIDEVEYETAFPGSSK